VNAAPQPLSASGIAHTHVLLGSEVLESVHDQASISPGDMGLAQPTGAHRAEPLLSCQFARKTVKPFDGWIASIWP
jgi:hypothetical protein